MHGFYNGFSARIYKKLGKSMFLCNASNISMLQNFSILSILKTYSAGFFVAVGQQIEFQDNANNLQTNMRISQKN